MATTTKQFEVEKIARRRIRIKEILDEYGDTVYVVQRKRWYGWSSVTCHLLNYTRAKVMANIQIEKEMNRLLHKKTKYFYYPF